MGIPFRYIDFAPVLAQEKVLGITTDWAVESLQDTVVRANEGIVKTGVRVVNLETIILPAPLRQPDYATGANGFLYDEHRLVQVVRIWYTQQE